MYKREIYPKLIKRVNEPRNYIQVLAGPRQVGKTTLAQQVIESTKIKSHYASADEPTLKDSTWINQQWDIARTLAKNNSSSAALLVLDEIQKLPNWSETVKKLWDQDTWNKLNIKVMLLGSSALLIQHGLTESLTGRFELNHIPHWSFSECKAAFNWSVEKFIYFGGYPKAAGLIKDEERWSSYVVDSIIETSISRDVLLMTKINKPALLRRLFELGCRYSGQILSYQKMLGQLHEAGNTTTLAHYLNLLSDAGMITGLEKFYAEHLRQKASSPKFQVFNTALMTAKNPLAFKNAEKDRELWGRLTESAVGAHLINTTRGTKIKVLYWRDGNKEVDFVLTNGADVIAIEVKSGKNKTNLPGMAEFAKRFNPKRQLLVGETGVTIEKFLTRHPEEWF